MTSTADMATGDTIVVQYATTSDFAEDTYTDAASSLDCLVQRMGGQESLAYQSRGQRRLYNVFFSSDPSIHEWHRLKWTHQQGRELSTPKILEVLNTYDEGLPGEDPALWVVECEEVTNQHLE